MLASKVRAFALANGVTVAERGRLPRSLFVAYLRANPAEARALAADVGVTLAVRGRISAEAFAEIAAAVA